MRNFSILALLFVVVLLCESAWQNVLADHSDSATTDGMQRRLLSQDRSLMSSYVKRCVRELESSCGKRCKKFPSSKCLRDVLIDCNYGNMVRETFRRMVRTKYRKECGSKSNSTNGGGGGGNQTKNTTNTTRF